MAHSHAVSTKVDVVRAYVHDWYSGPEVKGIACVQSPAIGQSTLFQLSQYRYFSVCQNFRVVGSKFSHEGSAPELVRSMSSVILINICECDASTVNSANLSSSKLYHRGISKMGLSFTFLTLIVNACGLGDAPDESVTEN